MPALATDARLQRVDLTLLPNDLVAEAEALTEADIAEIFDAALASIGCALPADLVSVFDIYLVDQVMTHLGTPVGAQVAQQGFFALRHRSATINHPEADAVIAAALAISGHLAQRMRTSQLTQSQGLFQTERCEPAGTVFELAPYANN